MGVWSWFGYPSDLGGIFVVIFDFSRTSLHFDQISVGFGLDFRERGGFWSDFVRNWVGFWLDCDRGFWLYSVRILIGFWLDFIWISVGVWLDFDWISVGFGLDFDRIWVGFWSDPVLDHGNWPQ